MKSIHVIDREQIRQTHLDIRAMKEKIKEGDLSPEIRKAI